MARLIEARVIQKAGTIEELNNSDLKYYDGEQVFVKSDFDDNVISYKVGANDKKFNELPYPDFYAKGKVTPSSVFTGLPSGVYIPTLNGLYNGTVTVNLGEGYQVLHWDGSTLQKVVYPFDYNGIVYGGVIDDNADLSNPTEPIWYIASAGEYNTVPPITLSTTSILTWDGVQWSHIPFDLEVRGEFLVADTMDEMRSITPQIAQLLVNGTYKGITLLGYYEKGDTPAPIEYYLSDTTEEDDGGSVISIGSIKIEHKFKNEIDVKYYGVREGIDNTELFSNVCGIIADKKLTIKISGSEYLIDGNYGGNRGLSLVDKDYIINTDESVVFKIKPTNTQGYAGISLRGGTLVVNRLKIVGERNEHIGTLGEHGFGLDLREVKGVNIGYLEVIDCWGDGLYIGKIDRTGHETNKNVFINKCYFSNNRRQGMSVISVDGLVINDFNAINTNGTNPQSGIDFEPNDPSDMLKNIVINKVTTDSNMGYGILFAFSLMTGTVNPIDITINNWKSSNEIGFSITGYHQVYIPGKIVINDLMSVDSPQNAGVIWNYLNMPDFILNRPYILNCNRNKSASVAGSGIRIVYADVIPPSTPAFTPQPGDITPKIDIIEPSMFQSSDNPAYNVISVQGQGSNVVAINNVRIVNPKVVGPITQFRYPYYSNMQFMDAYDDASIGVILADTNCIQGRMIKLYHNQGATISTFVVMNPHTIPTKNTIKIEHRQVGVTFGIKFLNDIGYVLGLSTYNGMRLETGQVGAYIVLRQINSSTNVWQVVEASGVWRLVEGAVIKNVNFNLPPANANATTVGGVLQATASANSATSPSAAYTQAEVQSILTELRDLKTKLRTAGILAT